MAILEKMARLQYGKILIIKLHHRQDIYLPQLEVPEIGNPQWINLLPFPRDGAIDHGTRSRHQYKTHIQVQLPGVTGLEREKRLHLAHHRIREMEGMGKDGLEMLGTEPESFLLDTAGIRLLDMEIRHMDMEEREEVGMVEIKTHGR